MNAALTKLLREQLTSLDGVKRLGPVRRASVVYSADSLSDSIYLLDSGYIKIVRKGEDGKEVLLSIIAPGQIFGEHAILSPGRRESWAEVLHDGILFEIPRQVFLDFCNSHPEAWQYLTSLLLGRSRASEEKIGLLCLTDVESRILHYLRCLPTVFGITVVDGQEYSLPLSQSELASLIGATRETTSTTLNALARRGLVKLGRRMLTVPSADRLKKSGDEAQGASA